MRSAWATGTFQTTSGILEKVAQPTWSEPGRINWLAVDNAGGYRVVLYKNAAVEKTVSVGPAASAVDFLADMRSSGAADYTVTVQALGDGISYFDGPVSQQSASQTVAPLETPVVGFTAEGLAEWNQVTNAIDYRVKLFCNDAEVRTVYTADLSYDFSADSAAAEGLYQVKVMARNTNSLWLDSGEGSSVKRYFGDTDFSIWLAEGWSLVSIPCWATEIIIPETGIEAWLAFKNGNWVNDTTLSEELSNPAQAVFIKAEVPLQLRFNWVPITPDLEFASLYLSPGWNLISSGVQGDYKVILAEISYDGSEGLTQVYAPNSFNQGKGTAFTLPWDEPLQSLINLEQGVSRDMFPLDGYWVYLRGEAVVYTTPVSQALFE